MSAKFILEGNLDPEELKRYYSKLKEKMQTVLYNMERSVYYLDYINNDLFDVCNVDGEKISAIKLEQMKKNLRQRISNLRYTVIPEIKKIENSL